MATATAPTMDDRDGVIWFDGKLVNWRDVKIHVLTHSLHYGSSVFEGVRAYKTADNRTAIFRLNDHTKRLLDSAKIIQMQIPYSFDELNKAQLDVVLENNFVDGCYLRPIAFYGSEKLGVSPKNSKVHTAIAAWSWGAYLGKEALERGIRVKISSFSRLHVNVTMVKAKASGNYLNSIMANNEVVDQGYDEAVLLDTDGYVAEGSGENIFIVSRGKLFTPDLASCLDGITRRSIITIAEEMGLEVICKRITRDEVYTADEMFFCGTAAEITPIREIDNRQIGEGKRGEITAKLQQRFFDIVSGKEINNPLYKDWLTFI